MSFDQKKKNKTAQRKYISFPWCHILFNERIHFVMLLRLKNGLLSARTTDATHRWLEVEPLNKAAPQMNGIYPVEHKKRKSGANINFLGTDSLTLPTFPNRSRLSWWDRALYLCGNIVHAQTEDSLVNLLLTHVSTGRISALELLSLEGVFTWFLQASTSH